MQGHKTKQRFGNVGDTSLARKGTMPKGHPLYIAALLLHALLKDYKTIIRDILYSMEPYNLKPKAFKIIPKDKSFRTMMIK